ncbi:ATP-binding cassette domain-containing protein [Zunongwangia sp. H14]|uniref:ATP-binding cassette domain-containing protein n=1 Tax=Zunongwangia sp. H14 TaxID=3240792 RepID=UPI0035678364
MKFEIDNVALNYSGKTILNGVYLKAEKGRITGILGKNGSGKSSLIKIFFGSLKPKNRLIKIDDKPFLKPLYRSGKAKYLPQHPLLPENIKVAAAFELFKAEWQHFME